MQAESGSDLIMFRQYLISLFALATGTLLLPAEVRAQDLAAVETNGAKSTAVATTTDSEARPGVLPVAVSKENFAELFEQATGHSIAVLSSPLRTSKLTKGRIELTLLAVTRFDLRSTDLAALLGKHQSSLTRWLNLGLQRETEDQVFRDRINQLDAKISAAARRLLSTKR